MFILSSFGLIDRFCGQTKIKSGSYQENISMTINKVRDHKETLPGLGLLHSIEIGWVG
jgi:hypothetical protein